MHMVKVNRLFSQTYPKPSDSIDPQTINFFFQTQSTGNCW